RSYSARKFFRFTARNGERGPVGAREMLGHVHDLADVICVMRKLPIDGLRYGMSFRADIYFLTQMFVGQWRKGAENVLPARLPDGHQFGSRLRRRFKFGITLAIGFFAVAGKKISEPRTHVAGQVFDDDGDGI